MAGAGSAPQLAQSVRKVRRCKKSQNMLHSRVVVFLFATGGRDEVEVVRGKGL